MVLVSMWLSAIQLARLASAIDTPYEKKGKGSRLWRDVHVELSLGERDRAGGLGMETASLMPLTDDVGSAVARVA